MASRCWLAIGWGGEDLRVAGPLTAVQQGLREVARDRGGDALWRYEPADAEEVSASSMKRSRPGFAFAKLLLETVWKIAESFTSLLVWRLEAAN